MNAHGGKNAPLMAGEEAPVRFQLLTLFWMLGPAFVRWAESHMERSGFTPKRLYLMGILYETRTDGNEQPPGPSRRDGDERDGIGRCP